MIERGSSTMTEARTLNRPRLLETLAYIEAHPENWDQAHWALLHPGKDATTWQPDNICGSSFCFAGRAMADEGFVPYLRPYEITELIDVGEVSVEYFIPVKIANKLVKKFKKTGTWDEPDDSDLYYAEHQAAKILGISTEDAYKMFHADNTLLELREMVAYLLVNGDLHDFDSPHDWW